MLVYLLRHAEAETLAQTDHARRLTRKGEDQAERVGKFCRKQGIHPSVILSSPVTRALQTAKIAAKHLDDSQLVEAPWAACGMDPFEALRETAAYDKLSSIMLVGHQPDLGALAAVMIGLGNSRSLYVRKALLAGIDMSRGMSSGRGELQFFIPVKLM